MGTSYEHTVLTTPFGMSIDDRQGVCACCLFCMITVNHAEFTAVCSGAEISLLARRPFRKTNCSIYRQFPNYKEDPLAANGAINSWCSAHIHSLRLSPVPGKLLDLKSTGGLFTCSMQAGRQAGYLQCWAPAFQQTPSGLQQWTFHAI